MLIVEVATFVIPVFTALAMLIDAAVTAPPDMFSVAIAAPGLAVAFATVLIAMVTAPRAAVPPPRFIVDVSTPVVSVVPVGLVKMT